MGRGTRNQANASIALRGSAGGRSLLATDGGNDQQLGGPGGLLVQAVRQAPTVEEAWTSAYTAMQGADSIDREFLSRAVVDRLVANYYSSDLDQLLNAQLHSAGVVSTDTERIVADDRMNNSRPLHLRDTEDPARTVCGLEIASYWRPSTRRGRWQSEYATHCETCASNSSGVPECTEAGPEPLHADRREVMHRAARGAVKRAASLETMLHQEQVLRLIAHDVALQLNQEMSLRAAMNPRKAMDHLISPTERARLERAFGSWAQVPELTAPDFALVYDNMNSRTLRVDSPYAERMMSKKAAEILLLKQAHSTQPGSEAAGA